MEKWHHLLVFLVTILLLIALVAVGVRLSMAIHHTLLLFSLGALVAYALNPLANLFQRAKLKREASVIFVFVFVAIVIAGCAALLGGRLAAEASIITHNAPHFQARAMSIAARFDRQLAARNIHFSIVRTIEHPPAAVRDFAAAAGRVTLPFVRQSVTDIGESLIVLLIALYFMLFGAEMRVKFNALLPDGVRDRANLWETDVNRILGGFVRGQLAIALVMGALAAIGCLLIGIHLWLMIGLFVVLSSLIPVFGPYIGAIPAIIAALVGPTHFSPVVGTVLVVVLFVLINEGGSKILYPRLVGSALGLHTVLVLFVLFAGLEVGGIVGVLFAAPVTALAIVTIVHLYRFWQDLPDDLLSNAATRISRVPETHDQINHPAAEDVHDEPSRS